MATLSPAERWRRHLLYLEMKIDERDWAGAARVAQEIAMLEAEHASLRQLPIAARQP